MSFQRRAYGILPGAYGRKWLTMAFKLLALGLGLLGQIYGLGAQLSVKQADGFSAGRWDDFAHLWRPSLALDH